MPADRSTAAKICSGGTRSSTELSMYSDAAKSGRSLCASSLAARWLRMLSPAKAACSGRICQVSLAKAGSSVKQINGSAESRAAGCSFSVS